MLVHAHDVMHPSGHLSIRLSSIDVEVEVEEEGCFVKKIFLNASELALMALKSEYLYFY